MIGTHNDVDEVIVYTIFAYISTPNRIGDSYLCFLVAAKTCL
jgi:hypothetical protein